MRARDVIVVARRRAGLTQQQLARRLGVPQNTVARWESGATEPKFEAVQGVVGACGYELTLGFANADKGSWNSLIYEQLQRAPAERLLKLSRGDVDHVKALKTIGATGLRTILVGATAGALHGWPLLLDRSDGIELLVHGDDREQLAGLLAAGPHRERIQLLDTLPGARGYPDLARNAATTEVEGVAVRVAALVDLLRVALFERRGFGGELALALDATLQLTERLHRTDRARPRKLSERQAREEIDRWLDRQQTAA